jgi:hypothetical protein
LNVRNLPIIVKVNPKEQSAIYELDKEVMAARNRLELQQREEQVDPNWYYGKEEEKKKQEQPKSKGKEKKNKTKPKEEDKKKPLIEKTEEEQRQAVGELLDNMANNE